MRVCTDGNTNHTCRLDVRAAVANVVTTTAKLTGKTAFLLSIIAFVAGCTTAPQPDDETDDPASRWDSEAIPHMNAEERLAAMSLREQIGQRFMVYVPRGFGSGGNGRGEDDSGTARRYASLLKTGAPAGMIVYPWNFTDAESLRSLTEKLQRLSRFNPLGGNFLIAADQEWGRVAAYRFSQLPRFPSAARVAAQAQARGSAPARALLQEGSETEYLRSIAYITGHDLASMGININFAPVLDLTDRPDRSIIGDRSWGNDPDVVSTLGTAYIDGLTAAGVIPTVKHFPGHGVTRVDSHGRLPIVDMTLDDLRRRDALPFQKAIEAGVPAIMTAHILFPRIDPEYPVTISETFLHDFLRNEIGYEGVVISDGLSMGALADNYDIDLVLERALRLDVDLILLHDRYDFTEILERVERLIAAGRIQKTDIERGAFRVLQLKEQYGLLR